LHLLSHTISLPVACAIIPNCTQIQVITYTLYKLVHYKVSADVSIYIQEFITISLHSQVHNVQQSFIDHSFMLPLCNTQVSKILLQAHALSISISVHAIHVMHQIGQDLTVACTEQTYWGDGSWALHKLLLYSYVIHGNMRVDASLFNSGLGILDFLVREVTLLLLHFYYRREVPFRCNENIKTLSIGPAPDKATQVSCRF